MTFRMSSSRVGWVVCLVALLGFGPEVSAQGPFIQDVVRVADLRQGQVYSVFDSDLRTVAVAPLAATDQGFVVVISNPRRHTLTSTLLSVATTVPLITARIVMDPGSQHPMGVVTATASEVTTQTFHAAVPMEPSTVALGYGFDPGFPWRELPRDVRYVFLLRDLNTGQIVDYIQNLWVVPRNPSVPVLELTTPASPARFYEGAEMSFTCTASDPYDAALTDTAVVWRRGEQSVFGYGRSVVVTDWQAADHVVQVEATNSAYYTTAATLLVHVYPVEPPYSVQILSPTSGTSMPYVLLGSRLPPG